MKNKIVLCRDMQMVLKFLRKVDRTLPVPLSERVDLEKFARSSVEKTVHAIVLEGDILSAALVVYGFQDRPSAYLNLLATVPGCEGRGYAGQLMDAAEAAAREAGMTEFHLHTNAVNTRAAGFYERRGYRVLETQPKLHMAKQL